MGFGRGRGVAELYTCLVKCEMMTNNGRICSLNCLYSIFFHDSWTVAAATVAAGAAAAAIALLAAFERGREIL